MIKFLDCLVWLPNLKTLEILSIGLNAYPSRNLRRRARFPSIRELRITSLFHRFVRKCPNLESLTLTDGRYTYSPVPIGPYCRKLKRVGGVNIYGLGIPCGWDISGKLVNMSSGVSDH